MPPIHVGEEDRKQEEGREAGKKTGGRGQAERTAFEPRFGKILPNASMDVV